MAPARPRLLGAVAAAVAAGLAGCSLPQPSTDSFLGFITPYRIDIVQGNAVTREQVALVRPGMSRAQVREILGSPMLTDAFHAERWDFPFSIRRPGTAVQQRNVVAWFDGDALKRLDVPDGLPTEDEFVAAIAPLRTQVQTRVLELTPEQRQALPRPAVDPTPVREPLEPLRRYPPLEAP